jgi:indole-3-glycerol phosphate synthase
VLLSESIRRRQQDGLMPVLSEIKVRSPKDGDLLRGRRPEDLARTMASCPIAGLSVVTEPHDFGGDLELVRQVRPVVSLPILRKDFIKTEQELDETHGAGADAVLVGTTILLAQDPARALRELIEVDRP